MLLLFVMVAILGAGGVSQTPNIERIEITDGAADRLTLVLEFTGEVSCAGLDYRGRCWSGQSELAGSGIHFVVVDLSGVPGSATVKAKDPNKHCRAVRLIRPSAVEIIGMPRGVCSVTVDGRGDGATMRVP